MEACLKTLYDLTHPSDWTLCPTNCLCHDYEPRKCPTSKVVHKYCLEFVTNPPFRFSSITTTTTTTTTTTETAQYATSKSFSVLKTTVQMAGKAINYGGSNTNEPEASFFTK